jgi:nicotinate phosphoribosyltransferase
MSSLGRLPRLTPDLFRLPIEKIRAGYKSDTYFNQTREILMRAGRPHRVVAQLFQREDGATVCGIDQVLAILHAGAGHYVDSRRAADLFQEYLLLEKEAYRLWLNLDRCTYERLEPLQRQKFEVSAELARLWESHFSRLQISSLRDGDQADAHEPVLEIEGDLNQFAHLETLIVGALTDGTLIATNTARVVEAAVGKPVLMFGARHESHEAQAGSGYAAWIGGAHDVSTDEQGEWWGSKGIGTIPHALIAALDGDTVRATIAFADAFPDLPTVSLVDFENDCVGTSLQVARALGRRLWGVRLDTSGDLIDQSVFRAIQDRAEAARGETTGVTPRLVCRVRQALDEEGFTEVRIVVSGGLTVERIRRFEHQGIPVDAYGVGSGLLDRTGGRFEYTQDVVKPQVKRGRVYVESPRLKTVDVAKLADRVASFVSASAP